MFFVDDKSLGKLIKDKLPALQLAIIYYCEVIVCFLSRKARLKSASVLVVSLSLNSVLHVMKYLLALFIHTKALTVMKLERSVSSWVVFMDAPHKAPRPLMTRLLAAVH